MPVSGVDVHDKKGEIAWGAVAADGIGFAYIRAAYGVVADTRTEENLSAARAAGLRCGVYHFWRVTRDAQRQADLAADLIRTTAYREGDLPPALDIEDNPTFDGPYDPRDNAVFIAGAALWVRTVEALIGRKPVIYTRASFWKTLGNPDFGTCDVWGAHYDVASPRLPSGWSTYRFWQYGSNGHVAGIAGGCDVDRFEGTAEELADYADQKGGAIA